MQDFLKDSSDDLLIQDGDLVIGVSDGQHQKDLLAAQKGEFKQFPDVGVGIEDYINDSEIEPMLQMIRSEFVKDGMTVTNLSYDEQTGILDYDATY